MVSALHRAPLRGGAAASSESSCGAECGTQVTPMNVSSTLGPQGPAGPVAKEGGGQGSAASWEVRVSTARPHRRPPAPLLGKRPEADAGQSRGGHCLPGRRPAPAMPTPAGLLRGCRFSGPRGGLAGGGGSGRSLRRAGRGLQDRGAAAPPGGPGVALQATTDLNGTGGKRWDCGRFLPATPSYRPTWDNP